MMLEDMVLTDTGWFGVVHNQSVDPQLILSVNSSSHFYVSTQGLYYLYCTADCIVVIWSVLIVLVLVHRIHIR